MTERQLKVYITTKIVQAEPMTDRYFQDGFKGIENLTVECNPGYNVINPDGSRSWIPDKVFKATYHEIPYLLKKRGGENK